MWQEAGWWRYFYVQVRDGLSQIRHAQLMFIYFDRCGHFSCRGEKAFCSFECRESEIVINDDETGSNSCDNSSGNAGP